MSMQEQYISPDTVLTSFLSRVFQIVPMCSLVDNIDVDIATGHVWVTGHADLQLNQKYMIPPHTSISPSQVNKYCLCSSAVVQWLELRTLNKENPGSNHVYQTLDKLFHSTFL